MTFSGTLIADLMAAVERAELRAQVDEPLFAAQGEASLLDGFFASASENSNFDSKFIGVA
jgi:hypothetical protein